MEKSNEKNTSKPIVKQSCDRTYLCLASVVQLTVINARKVPIIPKIMQETPALTVPVELQSADKALPKIIIVCTSQSRCQQYKGNDLKFKKPFKPTEQKSQYNNIHSNMEQIHMQKTGREQSLDLPLFEHQILHGSKLQQNIRFDFQNILARIDSYIKHQIPWNKQIMYRPIRIRVRMVVMERSFIFGQQIYFIVKGMVYQRAGRVAMGLKSDMKGRLSFIFLMLLMDKNYNYIDR